MGTSKSSGSKRARPQRLPRRPVEEFGQGQAVLERHEATAEGMLDSRERRREPASIDGHYEPKRLLLCVHVETTTDAHRPGLAIAYARV